ncbi:MAG: hypothetical protein ACYCYP_00620 [Leptospirales bacterium]
MVLSSSASVAGGVGASPARNAVRPGSGSLSIQTSVSCGEKYRFGWAKHERAQQSVGPAGSNGVFPAPHPFVPAPVSPRTNITVKGSMLRCIKEPGLFREES